MSSDSLSTIILIIITHLVKALSRIRTKFFDSMFVRLDPASQVLSLRLTLPQPIVSILSGNSLCAAWMWVCLVRNILTLFSNQPLLMDNKQDKCGGIRNDLRLMSISIRSISAKTSMMSVSGLQNTKCQKKFRKISCNHLWMVTPYTRQFRELFRACVLR